MILRDLRKLQDILKEYNGKDLYIRFSGSLRTYIHVYNAQCLITKIVLLVGNGDFEDNQELEIRTDDIKDITFNKNEILLEMNGNYTIEIMK